uniref:STAS domain-containing protein n=1 Tax=Esox lucius TaxID=8010 RepID=A0A6Q2YBN9_ESOLU
MSAEEQGAGEFHIHRDVMDELCLNKVAKRRIQYTKPIKKRMKDSLRCSVPKLKRSVLGFLPVLSWLPRYSLRDNALGDLTSGISVGIMHLPQGMAYALLASVPPVFGLYTSFYPVLVYFIFGTSRHISIGTFAVISIMIGSVTEKLAPDSNFPSLNETNGTGGVDLAARDAYRVQIAASTTVLCGLFQILLGMMRFGFVVTYLSEPLVRGYMTGAATHVVASQLKYVFGIDPARFSGPLSQVYLLIDICRLLPETNIGALVVSLVALVVLITVKELNTCYEKKLPMPIPIELIVIIAATLISYYGDLNSQYNVSVVGEIPQGLKPPSPPDISLWGSVVGDAFAVAIVGYAINISLGKTFGLKHGYKVDSNQELVALGLSNTAGGFFQCYAVTSSLSRSLIQESTGGKTQVAGVISSVIVLVTVLQLGTLFEELPKMVWLVTLVCTVLLNLDIGLAASIAFSLLTVIFRSQLPRYSILGRVPGTELYLDTDTYEEVKEIPGVIIFRSSTTMYYTNAELYLDALLEKSGIDIGKLLMKKKKKDSEQKRADKKEEKRAKIKAKNQKCLNGHLPNGTVHPEDKDVEKDFQDLRGNQLAVVVTDSTANGKVNWAFDQQGTGSDQDSEIGSYGDNHITQAASTGSESESGKSADNSTHTIILDLSTASFVDTVTVKILKNIFRDYKEIGIDVYLAGCQVCVVEQLSIAGFFCESIPKSCLFATVHDAVLHSLRVHGDKDRPQYECVLDMSSTTKM